MEQMPDTPPQQALDRAIEIAGGKTSLMRKLNERGWTVGSHNTITHWRVNGVPEKYCPDIEAITGVRCEDLCPDTNWAVLRRPVRRVKTELVAGA